MNKEKILELAVAIVELDVKRDNMYEELMMLAGIQGEKILRDIQNGMGR